MSPGNNGSRSPTRLRRHNSTVCSGLDHYRSINRGDPAGSLDAWTTLAALAARTDRIRLGTLVSPVAFRHVSVLAKSVVTVDESLEWAGP